MPASARASRARACASAMLGADVSASFSKPSRTGSPRFFHQASSTVCALPTFAGVPTGASTKLAGTLGAGGTYWGPTAAHPLTIRLSQARLATESNRFDRTTRLPHPDLGLDRHARRNPFDASPGSSSTIFTGTRCTTFTKLPVAFSGGSRANAEPVPRWRLSTWPISLRCGKASTRTVDSLARADSLQLRLLEIGDDIRSDRHDRQIAFVRAVHSCPLQRSCWRSCR